MQAFGAGHLVGENSRSGGGEKGHDPIAEARRETLALKKVDNVLLANGIKNPADVKFEKDGRGFSLMQPCRKVFNVQEVIMDTSLLDEGSLGIRNKFIHQRPKTDIKHLSDCLGNSMNQGNGAIVDNVFGPIFLRK
jgi:hypothetical protein